MQSYYYFCDICGADTAVYESISLCPYCHATAPPFRLIGESTSGQGATAIAEQIKGLQAQWGSNHSGDVVGEVPKRHGWFRHRT